MRPTGCARTGRAGQIAANVARICRASSKTVMLTATPCRTGSKNSTALSVFDPDYFVPWMRSKNAT